MIKHIYRDHSNVRVQMRDSVMQSSVPAGRSHGEDAKTCSETTSFTFFFFFFLKRVHRLKFQTQSMESYVHIVWDEREAELIK